MAPRTLSVLAQRKAFPAMIGAACEALAAGRIGLPWNVQADFVVAGSSPSGEVGPADPVLFPLDAVLALSGQPVVRVYARASRTWTATDAGTAPCLLLLSHRHGLTSTINVGRTQALADTEPGSLALHRYRISGSHGVLDIDATLPAVRVRNRAATRGSWRSGASIGGLLEELQAVAEAARKPDPVDTTAAHLVEILDAAQASAASQRPIDLSSAEEGRP